MSSKKTVKKKIIIIITVLIVFAIFALIGVLNNVIIPNGKYNDALALMESGQYTEAITAFEALDGYKDSVEQIEACKTAILDGKYNEALALLDDEKYDEAYEAFIALDDYMDSEDKAKFTREMKMLKTAQVGDYVLFGSYEQDNNSLNGKEDIEWLVLDKQEDRILVISKYALAERSYNSYSVDVTWETCKLRQWLNDNFIHYAFLEDEKAMIPTVTVSADENPSYSTNPGNATQDRVFLLSVTEAEKYFGSDSERECEPTNFAVVDGVHAYNNGNCQWWLRSPGSRLDTAAYVGTRGALNNLCMYVYFSTFAVRPALWIELNP